ncbi:uncharacterized protein [Misgurnus anguillicaudatus]|uniref:uncharacterized protein n=1 Tax=Misgurnus anguillicaudatus TaxID=75329 RepID=UPI003CCF930B
MKCASDPEWWSSISTQTITGSGPFPPQRGLPFRDYARAVEKSKGCYPEVLASAYLVAGMNEPPPIREREGLLHLPYWDLVDCLDNRQSSPRGIMTGAIRLERSTPVSPALEVISASGSHSALPASRRRKRRTKRASEPAQPETRQPPVQPVTRHPPVQPETRHPPVQPETRHPPVQPGTRHPPVQPETRHPPVQPETRHPPVQPETRHPPVQPETRHPPVQPETRHPPVQPETRHPPVQPETRHPPVQPETRHPPAQPPAHPRTRQPPVQLQAQPGLGHASSRQQNFGTHYFPHHGHFVSPVIAPPPLHDVLFLLNHPNPFLTYVCLPLLFIVMLSWVLSIVQSLVPRV